jgi:hypothetical protein
MWGLHSSDKVIAVFRGVSPYCLVDKGVSREVCSSFLGEEGGGRGGGSDFLRTSARCHIQRCSNIFEFICPQHCRLKENMFRSMWGSHSGGYEQLWTSRRNISLPFSRWKYSKFCIFCYFHYAEENNNKECGVGKLCEVKIKCIVPWRTLKKYIIRIWNLMLSLRK